VVSTVLSQIESACHEGQIEPLSWRFAQMAARLGDGSAEEVVAACLVAEAEQRGHLCLELAQVREQLFSSARLLPLPLPAVVGWLEQLRESPLVGAPESTTLLVLDRWQRLHLRRLWDAQVSLVAGLSELLDDSTVSPLTAATPLAAESHLSEQQSAAVRAVLNHRLTLITGGPGTGKTTAVSHLVAQFIAGGSNSAVRQVLLAAPTGQATVRLEHARVE